MGLLYLYLKRLGPGVAQWLRCCAKSRKVASSIPAGLIGIFHIFVSRLVSDEVELRKGSLSAMFLTSHIYPIST